MPKNYLIRKYPAASPSKSKPYKGLMDYCSQSKLIMEGTKEKELATVKGSRH